MKNLGHPRTLLLTLAFGPVGFLACGGGGSTEPPPASQPSAGTAGAAGAAGAAGTAGKPSAGAAGSSGSAGAAGASGSAGKVSAGAAGSSGGAGAAGIAGAGAAGGGGAPTLPTTLLGQIQALPAPVFKPGNTLPPLSWQYCLWSNPEDLPFETALVEKYGYGYSLHEATKVWNDQLDNPASDMAKKVAKNKQDPSRYKLWTTARRPLYVWDWPSSAVYKDYLTKDLPSRCPGCAPGLLTSDSSPPASATFSPAADPHWYDLVGDDAAEGLAVYKARGIPLSVVYDLAETGIDVSAGSCFNGHWDKDPAVLADIKAFLGKPSAPPCSSKDWAVYASHRIGRSVQRVTDKIEASLPPGAIYVRFRTEGNMNRERASDWWNWAPWYEDIQGTSMLPNMTAAYGGDEGPHPHWGDSSWDPKTDMVTGSLASIAFQIANGAPLSYNAVSGGWPTAADPSVSEIDRYMGYLKLLYAAGNLGAVASFWSPGLAQDKAGKWTCSPNAALPEAAALQPGFAQMVALGEVHALFSHFEQFLREGSLLAGPGIHRFTAGLPQASQIPANELNCHEKTKAGATVCDRTARVVARRLDGASEWIVVGFAATGPDQVVSVELPGAGTIQVQCRAAGALHHVTLDKGAPVVKIVDTDPMHPTKTLTP